MTLKRELSYNIHGYCCIYSLFFQYPLLGFIAKIAMLFIPLSLSANPNSQLHQTDLRESFVTTYINLSKTLKDENVIIINKKSELKKIEEKKNIEEIKINDNSSVSVKTTDVITNDVDKVKEETTTESVTKTPEEGASPANEISSEQKKETTSVNINESSIEELTTISGIGESKAKAIIEYRTANGPFKSVEEIKNVSGIGDKLYDKIKAYITI